jgi:hypothetical protein
LGIYSTIPCGGFGGRKPEGHAEQKNVFADNCFLNICFIQPGSLPIHIADDRYFFSRCFLHRNLSSVQKPDFLRIISRLAGLLFYVLCTQPGSMAGSF